MDGGWNRCCLFRMRNKMGYISNCPQNGSMKAIKQTYAALNSLQTNPTDGYDLRVGVPISCCV